MASSNELPFPISEAKLTAFCCAVRILGQSTIQRRCAINTTERDRLFKLLKHYSSLGVISQALKAKGLAYSASSWDDLFEKRLIPALKSGQLERADLVALLREVEEYGGQHVFMYRTSKTYATQLTNPGYIRKKLAAIGREDLLDCPPVLEQPKDLTLSGVRIEGSGEALALVIQAVEGRTYRRFLGEETEGDVINRRYRVIEERAVYILRVYSNGFGEVRIQSHRSSSNYLEDINKISSLCNPIVEVNQFQRVSVIKAKKYLWDKRKQLGTKIRFADSRCRNAAGNVLTIASGGEQANLYDDAGSTASVDAFVKHDGNFDRSDVFWLKASNGSNPSKDLHTILDGEINQVILTMTCSRSDFNWVLNEIRQFNES